MNESVNIKCNVWFYSLAMHYLESIFNGPHVSSFLRLIFHCCANVVQTVLVNSPTSARFSVVYIHIPLPSILSKAGAF